MYAVERDGDFYFIDVAFTEMYGDTESTMVALDDHANFGQNAGTE